MEVREPSARYLVRRDSKQTDLGIIPSDWDVVAIGQVSQCLIGLTYSPLHVRDFGTLVLRSSNIQKGKLTFDDNVFVDMDVPERAITRKDDILICVRNGSRQLIGKCALIDEETAGSAFGAFMSVLRADSAKFLFYHFQSGTQKRQIDEVMGATINQITNRDMAAFKVIWPPTKAEQEAIAEALSDADALIESLEQLITKKRHLKQGAMQELLTGKKRLPGFNGEWEQKILKNVVQTPVTDGPHLTPQFFNEGIPFLSVNNLAGNKIDLSDPRYISKEDHAVFSKKCKPRRDDLLLGKAASVGLIAIVDVDADFNIWSPIAMIRIDANNVPKFIYYAFQSSVTKRQIELLTNSSSQGNIGMGDIERLVFFLPPRSEQTAIATILSDMDAEITALQTKLTKARHIKQGMMQELLTGRIRLV